MKIHLSDRPDDGKSTNTVPVRTRWTPPPAQYGALSVSDALPPRDGTNATPTLERYAPINYAASTGWGTGAPIRDRITEFAWSVYQALLPQQDQRGDQGHVDTVIWFTTALADIMKLPALQKEAAVLLAIVHDAGWITTPNINQRWNQLATLVNGTDPEAAAHARQEMFDLRWGHQHEAGVLARRYFGEHPLIEAICLVAEDHDTRTKKPDFPAFLYPFLDGDWLSRIALAAAHAQSAGNYNRQDPDASYRIFTQQFNRDSFLLPCSFDIARIETANTMLQMRQEFNWTRLPSGFEAEYAAEIARLSRRELGQG